jgi:glycosyltransferase involved in cell wall biosynthesis
MKRNPHVRTRKVTFILRYVPQYRKEFYVYLKEVLYQRNIELELVYGQPSKADGLKGDTVEIPWGIKIRNLIFYIGNRELYWQPIFTHIKGVDLLILEGQVKLLVTLPLILYSKLFHQKIAFWGLGIQFHTSKVLPLVESIRKSFLTKGHWYFAYTDRVAEIVHNMGFPIERITVIQNAIDTLFLAKARESITDEKLAVLKDQIGLKGNHVGLYIGAMYKEKKMGFLLEACKLIRQRVPDFEMLMIGAGSDAHIVTEAAAENPWIHYLGSKFGEEKVPYFALSKLFLIPGSVGLAILDSFSLGVPLVTTKNPDQAPELDYLIDGVNGILVQGGITPIHYAKVVSDLLVNENKLHDLVNGCRESAKKYTIENMVNNFSEGIIKAIYS